MAGYAGTPLAKKLGLEAGRTLCLIDAPESYRDLFDPWPEGIVVVPRPSLKVDIVHAFATSRAKLAACLPKCRKALRDDAVVWISWPKKAAKLATDISEDVVRELALPLGFVDIKVCAVDTTWSGLKLVVRRQNRKA